MRQKQIPYKEQLDTDAMAARRAYDNMSPRRSDLAPLQQGTGFEIGSIISKSEKLKQQDAYRRQLDADRQQRSVIESPGSEVGRSPQAHKLGHRDGPSAVAMQSPPMRSARPSLGDNGSGGRGARDDAGSGLVFSEDKIPPEEQRARQLELRRQLERQIEEDKHRKDSEAVRVRGLEQQYVQQQPEAGHYSDLVRVQQLQQNQQQLSSPTKARGMLISDVYDSEGMQTAMTRKPAVDPDAARWRPSGKHGDDRARQKMLEQRRQLEEQQAENERVRKAEQDAEKLKEKAAMRIAPLLYAKLTRKRSYGIRMPWHTNVYPTSTLQLRRKNLDDLCRPHYCLKVLNHLL